MTTEPAKPSHDFLGLSDGAIGCRPNEDADGVPADVARTTVTEDEDDDPLAPVVRSRSISEANPARKIG